jgi:hypothetical protein
MSEYISNRTKKIAHARDVNLKLSFAPSSAAQDANDFARWNPRRDVIYFGILDGPIAIDDEHCRLGDASPLIRIVDAPILATRHSVSHKIGNGSRSSRRNASDLIGGSTDTASTSAPAGRISA